MPTWLQGFVWLLLYWSTVWIVPYKRLCRGLFTRFVLKRVVPPRRIWNNGGVGHSYRYMLWLGMTLILQYGLGVLNTKAWNPIFWAPLILVLLDDYIFGDDDAWKRRWEGVKNKIKWQMELPPEPTRQETA